MENTLTRKNWLPYLLIIAGFVAFLFAFIIMVEKLHVSADPNYVPPCTINPFVSCSTVMASPQASMFGFPNPLVGIAGFPIVFTVGFAMLAGVALKRWFWRGMQVGLTLATIWIYWFFYSAVYVIGSLCIYCMIVWLATIPLFVYLTAYNLREGHLSKKPIVLKRKHTISLLILMYGVMVVGILIQFWSYWKTLF